MESPFPAGPIIFSFELLPYIYFNVAFVIIAYPLYRIIGGIFNWELDIKTPANLFSDMMALVRYGFIVFVIGGYARTFNWIMILSFYMALFGFALLAELPFARHSLATQNNWPVRMWILFIFAVLAVLLMAGFHIYLIIDQDESRSKDNIHIALYLGCLIIPVILMTLGYIFKQEQNTRFLTKSYFNVIRIFKRRPQLPSANENQQPQLDTEALVQVQPFGKIALIHIHHWQIFYTLAFFTRFDHPVSQIAGGISLGIYTQGIGAYGPDNFLEEI
ncbi:6559_t:CDS:2 [Funneliformis geosporum]|uniref:12816_t:CDS:1 n=1 Tax=Funneliformis geosporum TaxID=1117311 RepID=A0A9W4SGL5_9GLOM|nr:6559_t:CDS:2 [Funneliformis geosporum]CAI2167724.1 12816_t:CDS:2 [Funneliformis geosporum]